MAADLGMNLQEAQRQTILHLNELDEIRQDAFQHTDLVQHQRVKSHDRYIKKKQFKIGDSALLFDSKFKNFKGKFNTHWLDRYEVETIFDNGSVKIKTIDDGKVFPSWLMGICLNCIKSLNLRRSLLGVLWNKVIWKW